MVVSLLTPLLTLFCSETYDKTIITIYDLSCGNNDNCFPFAYHISNRGWCYLFQTSTPDPIRQFGWLPTKGWSTGDLQKCYPAIHGCIIMFLKLLFGEGWKTQGSALATQWQSQPPWSKLQTWAASGTPRELSWEMDVLLGGELPKDPK